MQKKSQSAFEFFVIIIAVMFLFAGFFLAIQENIADKTKQQRDLITGEIAIAIQDEINLASRSSEGYAREFKIPESINGEEYDASIEVGMVYVKTKNEKHAVALPVLPVSGNVVKGSNSIRKLNGIVYLNE